MEVSEYAFEFGNILYDIGPEVQLERAAGSICEGALLKRFKLWTIVETLRGFKKDTDGAHVIERSKAEPESIVLQKAP